MAVWLPPGEVELAVVAELGDHGLHRVFMVGHENALRWRFPHKSVSFGMVSSAIDDLGVDNVDLAHGWCVLIGVQVDALTRATLNRVDGGLLVAPWHRNTRGVTDHTGAVTDVTDAVLEHDEELGAVVDA
jgi:hypothetical protein